MTYNPIFAKVINANPVSSFKKLAGIYKEALTVKSNIDDALKAMKAEKTVLVEDDLMDKFETIWKSPKVLDEALIDTPLSNDEMSDLAYKLNAFVKKLGMFANESVFEKFNKAYQQSKSDKFFEAIEANESLSDDQKNALKTALTLNMRCRVAIESEHLKDIANVTCTALSQATESLSTVFGTKETDDVDEQSESMMFDKVLLELLRKTRSRNDDERKTICDAILASNLTDEDKGLVLSYLQTGVSTALLEKETDKLYETLKDILDNIK